jgi:hypothetical protein
MGEKRAFSVVEITKNARNRSGQLWLFYEKTVLPVLSWEIIYIYNKHILLGYW